MADQESDLITGLDATPSTYKSPREVGGVLREDVAHVQIAADGADGDVIRFMRVHSSDRISQLFASGDGADTDNTAAIGLYETPANGGAVKDEDFFASAWAGLSTGTQGEDVTYESGILAVENEGKTLWEQLGESEDPDRFYDVALTLDAAADAAVDVTLKLRYVGAQ